MMSFLRNHWPDVGAVLAVLILVGLFTGFFPNTHPLPVLLWVSLFSLLVHQFEEYRWPGYFPQMLNCAVYGSPQPDRFPLNTQSSLVINVVVGWSAYLLAAIFGSHLLWLALGTILVSVGNCFAHIILFNIKGRTVYNPGMGTAAALFLPVSGWFFYYVISQGLMSPLDWIVGILLGGALNYFGIIKVIDFYKDPETTYIFPARPRYFPGNEQPEEVE